MADILERLRAALADRYQIDGEIGRGGMATVFLASDLKHGRGVAIKVLHPELAATLGSDRFHREIMLAAKLQHPHILALYDSGNADGLFYYVMPFVVGESLRDRLNREHQLPIDDALQVTLEVADALGYAHSLGIVHRDIKPENILLSGGHALVADFGIARAVTAAGSDKLTETGMAVGTPLYMSPEQSVGEEVGPTADIYSLGCVLFEMLAGQPPFTGITPRSIMARHAMEPVPSLQIVRDTVPNEVEDAIFAALAKVPADRPPTAAQFAEMLGTPLATTSTRRTLGRTATRRAASRQMPALERPSPARSPRLWIAVGLVALLGGIAAWRFWPRHPGGGAAAASGLDPHRLAVLYFEDLSPKHDLGYLADGLTEGLITALGGIRSLSVVSSGGVAPYRGKPVPPDSVARALGAGYLVEGSVEPSGDRIRLTLRLVEGSSGADFKRSSFEQPAANVLALKDSLSEQAARLIRSALGEDIRVREQRESTQDPEAWALVQRAEQSGKRAEEAIAAGDSVGRAREFGVADSLLALAQKQDPRWPDPPVIRAQIAYRRSRLVADDQAAASKFIDAGLGYVAQALVLDGQNSDALEVRGNLRYWRYLLGLEADPAKAKQLLAGAQADLEAATKANPAQAGAWATLSHLYYQIPNKTAVDVNFAARRALEEDAYLSNADVILSRLFFSSYDLGNFVDAIHWCDEGQRRYPRDPKFVECRLLALSTKAREADPALAWKLADSLVAYTPEHDRAYTKLNSQLEVAAVLARAGLGDSARHLIARSRGDADLDPTRDLVYTAAFVSTLLGDKAEAISLLRVYLTANPARRASLADDPGWWFRPLADDPAWGQLVGGGH